MGLREDIANAIGSLAATLPEMSAEMRHGTESGQVVRTSGHDFAETVSESGPAEAVRYIANARDFPTLEKGAAVGLDGSLRVVVGMKSDPVGATYTIGLSDALDGLTAVYSGTRREDGKVQKFRHAIDLFAIREAAPPPELADSAALSGEQSYLACVAVDTWPETSPPQTGDAIEFTDTKRTWETVRLKVASVVRHDGWWMLRARPRGGA